jgi:pyroglutamyl-peptidase
MKIVISGFEAFGEHKFNPTQKIIEILKYKDEFSIHPVLLPVTFADSYTVLQKKIVEIQPDFVFMLGLDGKRDGIQLEQFAHNLIDARIPDNKGVQPTNVKIDISGPLQLTTQMNLKVIQSQFLKNNFNTVLSDSSGSYVCNFLYYSFLADPLNTVRPGIFIHIPNFEQDSKDLELLASIICQVALKLTH